MNEEESTMHDSFRDGPLKWFNLTYTTLVLIVQTFWNHTEIRELIYNFPLIMPKKFNFSDEAKWQVIEDKVIEKAQRLALPGTLKHKVGSLVKPIGFQLYSFCVCSKSSPFDNLYLPREPSWSIHGVLDGKKTAESLIGDERIDIMKRYEIACVFCLEDFIPELWEKIPVGLKNSLYELEDPKMLFQHRKLVVYWTHRIKGEDLSFLEKMRRISYSMVYDLSPLQWIFMYSAANDLKVATEYFLEKLTLTDIQTSLFRYEYSLSDLNVTGVDLRYYGIRVCEVFYSFFFSSKFTLSGNELAAFLESFAFRILFSSLRWPRQFLFLDIANTILPTLREYLFSDILKEIVHKVKIGYRDWDYPYLFKELWKKGKDTHKSYFIQYQCIANNLLIDLLENMNMESVLLILKDATISDLEDLFYYRRDIICILMYNDGWEVLQLLAHLSIPTKETIYQFEEEFRKRDITITAKDYIKEEKVLLRQFFRALDNIIRKPDIKWHYRERMGRKIKMRVIIKKQNYFYNQYANF